MIEKNNENKVVLIFSGGMDSTTLLYDLIKRNKIVYALSINYNQRHKKELDYAKKTTKKLGINHKIIDLSAIDELLQGSALTSSEIAVPEGHYEDENMKMTVVPNRNMILLSLAIGYAISIKADSVYYAAHKGDHAIYPDCRPEFVDAVKEVAKLVYYEPIEIYAPYLHIDKGDIAIIGKKLGVDYSLTWSCYNGKEKPCGKCGSCTERLEAFKKAEMIDPLKDK